MTLSEHLEELRTRLVRALIAVGLGTLLAFWQIDVVMDVLWRPLRPIIEKYDVELIQFKAYGGFFGAMMISFFTGLVLTSPVVLHQVWSFVGAGLYRHERRAVKFYAVPGFFLFLAGAALAYFFVMPWALDFLIGYAQERLGVVSKLNFTDYVSLIAWSMFIFGMVFQLPVVMVFLMRVGVVEPATFRRWRRAAIVAAFALGMILTPPDVVTQIALASCMILLYEGAILVGSTVARKREAEEEPERKEPGSKEKPE